MDSKEIADKLHQYEKVKGMAEIEVTEEEYFKLCENAGMPIDKAKFQLKIMRGLGSGICIGNRIVKVGEV